jgi:putative ABC transport system permease protein
MTAELILFQRLILRPLRSDPVRTALTMFAVALGIAVVLAIDLAGDAAAGSFHSSLESLTGKGDLLLTATAGLDEHVLAKLNAMPYPLEFSPRVEDFATVNGNGEAVPFIGLDLIGHASGQLGSDGGSGGSNPLFQERAPVWVGSRLGLHKGEHVRLLINDAEHEFEVAGVIPERRGAVGDDNVIVTDIAVAQRVTGKAGKLDSIDVVVPPGRGIAFWREQLGRELGPGVRVSPQGTRTEESSKMLAAFRWNLRVLSYIALVVGAFLIYNTISVSVVRRRSEIGILRALGATRGMITAGFLAEALFFAITGSLLGLLLGRLMAAGAVKLIGNTVQALYVSSQPSPIHLGAGTALTGIALGVLVSLLSALAPALEASHIPPVEAMARGREEYTAAVRSRHATLFAVLLAALGGLLAQLPPVARQPVFAYLSVLCLIAATAAAIPAIVIHTGAQVNRLLTRLLGVEALLAMQALRGSIGRTAVLASALATSVAMTASVGIMVGSFRQTVSVWMDNQLRADLYLRPAGFAAADQHPTMSADIADAIERLPGVAAVDRFRAYPISYEGLPATLAGGQSSRIRESASTMFLPGENRAGILDKLATGDYAVVSEPFANKHRVHVGSILRVPLAGAERQFEVLGIYYDYSTERGYVVLDRQTLLKYLPDPAVSNVSVYLKPGADADIVRHQIDGLIGGRAIAVFSNGSLRRAAIATFDRTFRITYALEAVAIVVAVLGIAGALLAMVIDRRREFALLRFLGALPSQVRKIILCEAGLLGLLANTVGLGLGVLLSLILVFVINKQSFGWTIQFHWPVAVLLGGLSAIFLATLLAGLYPARAVLAMKPIEVIHEE